MTVLGHRSKIFEYKWSKQIVFIWAYDVSIGPRAIEVYVINSLFLWRVFIYTDDVLLGPRAIEVYVINSLPSPINSSYLDWWHLTGTKRAIEVYVINSLFL